MPRNAQPIQKRRSAGHCVQFLLGKLAGRPQTPNVAHVDGETVIVGQGNQFLSRSGLGDLLQQIRIDGKFFTKSG